MKRLLSLSLTILFVVSPAYTQELGEIGVVGSSVHPTGDFKDSAGGGFGLELDFSHHLTDWESFTMTVGGIAFGRRLEILEFQPESESQTIESQNYGFPVLLGVSLYPSPEGGFAKMGPYIRLQVGAVHRRTTLTGSLVSELDLERSSTSTDAMARMAIGIDTTRLKFGARWGSESKFTTRLKFGIEINKTKDWSWISIKSAFEF